MQRLTKRSQYWSSIDPEVNQELEQVLAEAKELAREKPDAKNRASQIGLLDVPAPESPGGVISFGPIERTTIIALSGVRALATSMKGPDQSDRLANDQTALRRYLFALALASAADPGVWDLREGCILVQESKTENGKIVADPSAFTAVKVKHSGEENPFTLPSGTVPSDFLAAAARAFFGEKDTNGKKEIAIPATLELSFHPHGARDEVRKDDGNSSVAKKKTIDQLIEEVQALPTHASKTKSALKKLGKGGLEKLIADAQQPGAGEQASSEGTEVENAGSEA